MTRKITVKITQTDTYETLGAAREFIKKLVDAGIIFFEVHDCPVNETPMKPEKAPAPKPEKKVRGPYKKKSDPKPHTGGMFKKFTKPVLKFMRENCDTKDNGMLAKAVEDKFGFPTTKNTVAWQLSQNKIRRKNRLPNKFVDDDDEEDLPTLPPENA